LSLSLLVEEKRLTEQLEIQDWPKLIEAR
jgi:hypothetical protein